MPIIEVMTGRRSAPTIIGRDRELDAMTGRLDTALEGSPTHLLVAGEAGIGKTRLVAETSRLAAERGMRVLAGACANIGDGGVPYGPIVEALRGLSRDLAPDDLAEIVGPSGGDLARLVPALSSAVVPETGGDTNASQARVLEALLGLLQRLAERKPVLLVMEDLHWADPATRDSIAFIVRNLRSDRVLLLLTFRSDELHRRHPLMAWLAELERSGRVERIDLERLDPAHTNELLNGILGEKPAARLVDRIHARSDGNPFFVEELVMAGDTAPERGSLPPTLHGILVTRLAAAPDLAQIVIGAAAVAGRRVEHGLLAAVAGLDETDLLDGLRSAVSNQLLVVEADPRVGDVYAFRHALLQEAAYEELLPGERRRLHGAVAEAIAEQDPGAGVSAAWHWSELAFHWSAARDDLRAFEASVRAGAAAERNFAFADAARHDERALDAWSGIADPERIAGMDRTSLLGRAAQSAWLSGDARRAVAWRREAVASIDPAADPTRAATLQAQLSRSLWNLGDT
jgi:predicted ATPase